jgi:hypothetical protein
MSVIERAGGMRLAPIGLEWRRLMSLVDFSVGQFNKFLLILKQAAGLIVAFRQFGLQCSYLCSSREMLGLFVPSNHESFATFLMAETNPAQQTESVPEVIAW